MKSIFDYIKKELNGIYPELEIKSISYLIVEKITGFTRSEIILNKNTAFLTEKQLLVREFVEKLKQNIPIQYVLGETEFYGLPFIVDNSVLIPRPETEELVEWIETDSRGNDALRMLDIGTGSGCIAIALKSIFPNASVEAFDVSPKALETARKNAEYNNTEVIFTQLNILEDHKLSNRWDIIVSNPPYIPEVEKLEILPHVLDHEPHLALFVPDNDPLLFYRQIAIFAQEHLTAGGKLYFEIHRDAGLATCNLLAEQGFINIVLRKDLSGNDRMIRAEKE